MPRLGLQAVLAASIGLAWPALASADPWFGEQRRAQWTETARHDLLGWRGGVAAAFARADLARLRQGRLAFSGAGSATGPPRPLGSWWTTFGLTSIYALERGLLDGPDRPRWQGGILFDGWVRDQIGSRDRERQRDGNTISDLFLGALYTYLLVDTWLAGDDDDRIERLRINIDAIVMNQMATDFFKAVAARERPVGINSRSFFSGHASGAATSAGLICAHHYGDQEPDGPLDHTVCGTAVLGALGAGVFRVVADRHWTTDVMAGWLSGFFFGYYLPTRWYYGTGPSPASLTILPIAPRGGVGFQLVATF